tara:strand:- start:1891 stop:3090 length:1200 start_codon:yes stop_codon:yes gene_type:complete
MQKLIEKEIKYCANIYKSLPVVINKGRGVYVHDVNGKKYFDYISGYSAVNHGHCHPRLVNVIKEQVDKLTITSRAFYNENLCNFSEHICKYFGYDKVIPMNTGVEGGETAIKIARRWGYENKGIHPDKSIILFCKNNFWGRTISACSSSNDPDVYKNFGPYTPGFDLINYNDIDELELYFEMYPNVAAFMIEPIQGEAGVIVPDEHYLKRVRHLCSRYNVLLIADEIQTGLGRTGSILETESCGIRPDILILGKSLSGGFMPISAVLANDNVMKHMNYGSHGSTYGGNPLACALATEALNIIKDEKLVKNSDKMGFYFREVLKSYTYLFIKEIRGKGLMNAIEFFKEEDANRVSNMLLEKGLICKITHGKTIRFLPPLTINNSEMNQSLELIKNVLHNI